MSNLSESDIAELRSMGIDPSSVEVAQAPEVKVPTVLSPDEALKAHTELSSQGLSLSSAEIPGLQKLSEDEALELAKQNAGYIASKYGGSAAPGVLATIPAVMGGTKEFYDKSKLRQDLDAVKNAAEATILHPIDTTKKLVGGALETVADIATGGGQALGEVLDSSSFKEARTKAERGLATAAGRGLVDLGLFLPKVAVRGIEYLGSIPGMEKTMTPSVRANIEANIAAENKAMTELQAKESGLSPEAVEKLNAPVGLAVSMLATPLAAGGALKAGALASEAVGAEALAKGLTGLERAAIQTGPKLAENLVNAAEASKTGVYRRMGKVAEGFGTETAKKAAVKTAEALGTAAGVIPTGIAATAANAMMGGLSSWLAGSAVWSLKIPQRLGKIVGEKAAEFIASPKMQAVDAKLAGLAERNNLLGAKPPGVSSTAWIKKAGTDKLEQLRTQLNELNKTTVSTGVPTFTQKAREGLSRAQESAARTKTLLESRISGLDDLIKNADKYADSGFAKSGLTFAAQAMDNTAKGLAFSYLNAQPGDDDLVRMAATTMALGVPLGALSVRPTLRAIAGNQLAQIGADVKYSTKGQYGGLVDTLTKNQAALSTRLPEDVLRSANIARALVHGKNKLFVVDDIGYNLAAKELGANEGTFDPASMKYDAPLGFSDPKSGITVVRIPITTKTPAPGVASVVGHEFGHIANTLSEATKKAWADDLQDSIRETLDRSDASGLVKAFEDEISKKAGVKATKEMLVDEVSAELTREIFDSGTPIEEMGLPTPVANGVKEWFQSKFGNPEALKTGDKAAWQFPHTDRLINAARQKLRDLKSIFDENVVTAALNQEDAGNVPATTIAQPSVKSETSAPVSNIDVAAFTAVQPTEQPVTVRQILNTPFSELPTSQKVDAVAKIAEAISKADSSIGNAEALQRAEAMALASDDVPVNAILRDVAAAAEAPFSMKNDLTKTVSEASKIPANKGIPSQDLKRRVVDNADSIANSLGREIDLGYYSIEPLAGKATAKAQELQYSRFRSKGLPTSAKPQLKEFRKRLIPLSISATKEGEFIVRAQSPDKIAENTKLLFELNNTFKREAGEDALVKFGVPYKSADDAALINDRRIYEQNHANGYFGDGSIPSGVEGFLPPMKGDPIQLDADPVIAKRKAEFFAMTTGTQPKESVDAPVGSPASANQLMSGLDYAGFFNFFDNVNKIQHSTSKDVLTPATETINLSRVSSVNELPIETKREVGAGGKFQREFAALGYAPANADEVFMEAALSKAESKKQPLFPMLSTVTSTIPRLKKAEEFFQSAPVQSTPIPWEQYSEGQNNVAKQIFGMDLTSLAEKNMPAFQYLTKMWRMLSPESTPKNRLPQGPIGEQLEMPIVQ